MTTTQEGQLYEAWEETLKRRRAEVMDLPLAMRDEVFEIIKNQKRRTLARWAEHPPSLDDVDEACRVLESLLPFSLEVQRENGVPLTHHFNELDMSVLVAELLDLRERVATLESVAHHTEVSA